MYANGVYECLRDHDDDYYDDDGDGGGGDYDYDDDDAYVDDACVHVHVYALHEGVLYRGLSLRPFLSASPLLLPFSHSHLLHRSQLSIYVHVCVSMCECESMDEWCALERICLHAIQKYIDIYTNKYKFSAWIGKS